jgi:hypothetical protein
MTDSNIMLVAGGGGGKSTFIGGLYHAAKKSDQYDVTYNVEIGDEEEIAENVIGRMVSTQRYPDKTDQAAVIRMKFSSNSFFGTGVTLELIDIPGEQQEQEIARDFMNEIENDNLDRSAIREKYDEEVSGKMIQEKGLTRSDFETLYRYSYIQSDRIIFLLNLYKVLYDQEKNLAYGSDVVEKIAAKKPTAMVVTALDTLQADSALSTNGGQDSTGLTGGFNLWEGARDTGELYEFLDRRLQVKPKVNAVLTAAQNSPDIDLFGTAVPSKEEDKTQKGGSLEQEGIGFKTQGFESLINWL